MSKAILIAIVLAALAAGAASGYASDPTTVIWTYDFDNQATGISPAAMTDPPSQWIGNIVATNWQTVDDGGGNIILKKVGASGGSSWKTATDQKELNVAGCEGQAIQIFHMKMKSFQASAGSDDANFIGIYADDGAGNCLGGWRIGSTGMNATVFVGATYSNLYEAEWSDDFYPDTNWHDYDMVLTRATGQLDWYTDGVQVGSYLYSAMAGYDFHYAKLASKSNTSTYVFGIDDLKVGTTAVPEPASLLAFATFGIGAFGLMRRRRA